MSIRPSAIAQNALGKCQPRSSYLTRNCLEKSLRCQVVSLQKKLSTPPRASRTKGSANEIDTEVCRDILALSSLVAAMENLTFAYMSLKESNASTKCCFNFMIARNMEENDEHMKEMMRQLKTIKAVEKSLEAGRDA